MKHLTHKNILNILFITFLCRFELSNGTVNRRWIEIDNRLFRIEPDGEYTWKEAAQECKKESTVLMRAEGNYDYTKLKDAIKQNFENYSSFWTSNKIKFSTIFDQLGLGKSKENQEKCKRFDNTFKYLQDDCEKSFGFICERQLLKQFSVFNDKEKQFIVEAAKEFTCGESHKECTKHQMSLLPFDDHTNNSMLREYIFFNYGFGPHFWFSFNNETHLNCATSKRNEVLNDNTKLGFICVRDISKPFLSMRHLILITFLSITAIGTIFVYIIGRYCCYKKTEKHFVVDQEDPRDFKIADIK